MYNSNFDIWIAGSFAAVTVDIFVYPVDTLKTRIQSSEYEKLYKDAKTGAVKRNVLFRGLYQGVWSVVLSTIPSSGAFFTTYEAVKYTLSNASSTSYNPDHNRLPFTHSLPTPIIHGIASSTAEMVACVMLTPAEVLKQNAQVVDRPEQSQGKDAGKTATRQVIARFRSQPWKLWSGYTALVGRNLPFTGLQFPIFEYVRSHVVQWRELRKKAAESGRSQWNPVVERAALTGLSASISGTIASIVTTPIDVIKTRVMLAASNDGSAGNTDSDARGEGGQKKKGKKKLNRGMFTVGREIFREEGIRGLFRGGAIRAGWTAVSLGMYLSMYEGGRFYLENRRREKDGRHPNVDVKSEGEAII